MKTMVSNMTHVCLGDVAREIKQKVPVGQELPTVGLEHLDPGEVELAHWDEGVETTFTKAFSKGQVLFGRRRAYLRKAAVAPFDGICSGDITVIAPKDNLSPRLLPFIIQNDALFEHAVTNSAGSLSPRVKWQSLSQFEFELPSIAKQEDLADILWTAQETRSHYRQLLTACDDVVKSQFVEMFGDPVANGKQWPVSTIKETAITYGDGPFGSNLKSSDYVDDGVRVIRLGNIQQGRFSEKDRSFVSYAKYEKLKRFECKPGEVVIATLGDPILRACIVPEFGIPSIHKADCMYYETDKRQLMPTFAMCAINHPSMLRRATVDAHGQTRGRINSTQTGNLPMILPPLALQQEFADFVAQVDKSKFAVQKALDELNATTKKILNQELGLGDV